MFWVMSVGLTSASAQANLSEQTLPHQEQQFVELSQRETQNTGEKIVYCVSGMISLQSSVLMLHYQSFCGV